MRNLVSFENCFEIFDETEIIVKVLNMSMKSKNMKNDLKVSYRGESKMISEGLRFDQITVPTLRTLRQIGLSKQCKPRSDAAECGV